MPGAAKTVDPTISATEKNTKAVEDLNRTLLKEPGLYGKIGNRGRGSISEAWNGYYLDNNLESMWLRKYGIYGL